MTGFPAGRISALLGVLVLAACGPDAPSAAPEQSEPRVQAEERMPHPEWASNPEADIRPANDAGFVVETGPHTVLWPETTDELAPPYRIRARLEKESGRRHEGYGIIFGARRIDGPEEAQRYSYFLIRGDGSFLVRLRDGPEVPVVLPWTRHDAIRPDGSEENPVNELEVRVGREQVRFLVNGQEVDRVPTAELFARGTAGLRVAHEVRLIVGEFTVEEGASGEEGQA